jgi:hypothetical protein
LKTPWVCCWNFSPSLFYFIFSSFPALEFFVKKGGGGEEQQGAKVQSPLFFLFSFILHGCVDSHGLAMTTIGGGDGQTQVNECTTGCKQNRRPKNN